MASLLTAQNKADLRLVVNNRIQSSNCFDIQLRSPHGENISLAGQNYRIFYNGSNLSFNKSQITSYLDNRAYGKIDIINTNTNNIGFLSLSIDARELGEKTVLLKKSAEWVSTLNICFDKIGDKEIDLTWADGDKTAVYATAQVALSEWMNSKRQQVLLWNELGSIQSDLNKELSSLEIKILTYPNPVIDVVNIDIKSGLADLNYIVIKDVIGREVVYDKIKNRNFLSYDLLNWPNGSYSVELFNAQNQKVKSEKLVKVTF